MRVTTFDEKKWKEILFKHRQNRQKGVFKIEKIVYNILTWRKNFKKIRVILSEVTEEQ